MKKGTWPFAKKNKKKPRTRALHCRNTFTQQAQMLQPQHPVESQIESLFILYHMQTPTSSTRRESDPYQPQQSETSHHFGNMQNGTYFPY